MATAVLISGQMRTFEECYPTQRWQIFRHYEPDIHFFVSCCDDAQADSSEYLRRHYKNNVHIERVIDPGDLQEIPDSLGLHAPYANAAGHRKLLLQHWGNKRVYEFFLEEAPAEPWETIIRIRPDQWIHRFEKPITPMPNECHCAWWGKFGGVNDRLAVMGPAAALWYFSTFDFINGLLNVGCPFHPETLVRESMRLGNVTVNNTLLSEFSTIRMGGQRRWPEITFSDIVEFIGSSK